MLQQLFSPKNSTLAMGYRYVHYEENAHHCTFLIEPMFTGTDLIYVPTEAEWEAVAPPWAKGRLKQIGERILTHGWHREVRIESGSVMGELFKPPVTIPGSIVSTELGRYLESQRFYDPGNPSTAQETRELWFTAERRFAEAVTGEVTIVLGDAPENGVFTQVSLPALRANPYATLKIYERH